MRPSAGKARQDRLKRFERTLGFDGDVAELRKLMAARLAFADTVHV